MKANQTTQKHVNSIQCFYEIPVLLFIISTLVLMICFAGTIARLSSEKKYENLTAREVTIQIHEVNAQESKMFLAKVTLAAASGFCGQIISFVLLWGGIVDHVRKEKKCEINGAGALIQPMSPDLKMPDSEPISGEKPIDNGKGSSNRIS